MKTLNHPKDIYTTIPNQFLQNPNISYGTKGLVCQLLSLPKNKVPQYLNDFVTTKQINKMKEELYEHDWWLDLTDGED